MKSPLLLLLVCLFTNCNKSTNLGNAIITENFRIYEEEDGFYPFDNYQNEGIRIINKPLIIEKNSDFLRIENTLDVLGLAGERFKIELNPELEIVSAEFIEWDDDASASDDKFVVEKVILEFNKNPFSNNYFIGYYTVQLNNENSCKQRTRNGKFKICTQFEKQMGKEWIRDSLINERNKFLN